MSLCFNGLTWLAGDDLLYNERRGCNEVALIVSMLADMYESLRMFFLYIMCNIVVKSLEGLSLPSAGRDKPDVGHNRNIHRIRRVKHY